MARPLGRVAFATLGSLGDLNPCIAVARALAARGAEAVIASSPEYQPQVERRGIRFAALGPGFARLRQDPALLESLARKALQGTGPVLGPILLPDFDAARRQLAQAAEGASLIVSHPLTLPVAARVAAEKGLPWAALALSPTLIPAREPSPRLVLGLFDAVLAEPRDGPPGLLRCGAPLYDGEPDPPDRRAIEEFLEAGEPPLVFVLGSAMNRVAGEFWSHAAQAARALGRRALLVTGRDAPQPAAPAPGVRAFGYLPYSMVFPRAAAIIHQGGIGTLSLALRSGRPELLVPFAIDQPDNARRAAALGVGRVLPRAQIGAESLARELAALLAEPRHAERAAQVAAQLRGVDGAGPAAEALLSLCKGP